MIQEEAVHRTNNTICASLEAAYSENAVELADLVRQEKRVNNRDAILKLYTILERRSEQPGSIVVDCNILHLHYLLSNTRMPSVTLVTPARV